MNAKQLNILLGLVAAIAVAVALYFAYSNKIKAPAVVDQNINIPTNQNNNAAVQSKDIFTDTDRKISLDYSGLSVQTSAPNSYIPAQNHFFGVGKDILALYLAPGLYKGTNLESAWANLAVSNVLQEPACYTASVSGAGPTRYDKTRTVNGNLWHYGLPNPSGDAAAGHTAATETYRLYKNSLCYEMVLGLSAFNRQNLEDPNSVKEYSSAAIFGYLGAVFNKLKVE